MAYGDIITPVGGVNYNRLDFGSYLAEGSTLDQPDRLSILNRGVVNNPTKPALFTVKIDDVRNSAVAGLSDRSLAVWFSIQFIPGQFTQSDIEGGMTRLRYFQSGDPLTKLLRGER